MINGLARGFLQVIKRYYILEGQTKRFFRARVQFCHRTARDYLLQTEDRHRAMLNSFPNFESSNLYTRIFLAEIRNGWHSTIHSVPIRIFPFGRSFRQNVNSDLVSKYELVVRELGPSCYFSIDMDNQGMKMGTLLSLQISFTAYAAWCGLDRFVLREVARDTTQLNEKSVVSCSVLCAAISAENYNLALRLLETGREFNHLCEMSPREDENWEELTLVPAIVIALWQIISTSVIHSNMREIWPK